MDVFRVTLFSLPRSIPARRQVVSSILEAVSVRNDLRILPVIVVGLPVFRFLAFLPIRYDALHEQRPQLRGRPRRRGAYPGPRSPDAGHVVDSGRWRRRCAPSFQVREPAEGGRVQGSGARPTRCRLSTRVRTARCGNPLLGEPRGGLAYAAARTWHQRARGDAAHRPAGEGRGGRRLRRRDHQREPTLEARETTPSSVVARTGATFVHAYDDPR